MNRRHFLNIFSLFGLTRLVEETPKPCLAPIVLQQSPVRGFRYRQPCDMLLQFSVGAALELRAEPENSYDRKAVAVIFQGQHLGYLPREDNAHVSRLLSQGQPLSAVLIAIAPERYEWEPLEIEIHLHQWQTSDAGQSPAKLPPYEKPTFPRETSV